MTRLRFVLLGALLAGAIASAGCGGGADAADQAPPPEVASELVPPTLGAGSLRLTEDDQAREAFSELTDRALVADGRLWQVREGDKLVATLQVTTVKTKVDLTDDDQRRSIVRHILPGPRQEIDVQGVSVSMSDTEDKTVFVWFGRDLLQVLQVKSATLDPSAILGELVTYQLQSPHWQGLPLPDEEVAE